MRKTLSIFAFLFSCIVTFGQKQKEVNLIQVDSTWGKEVFKFPIPFANDIQYEGAVEVRFPPKGWRDPNHSNFWLYAYAWKVNLNRSVNAKELASNLEKYFDGLNGVGVLKHMDEHKASANIVETKSNKRSSFFYGDIKTYDRFATNESIILHVLIESYYCKKEKETTILFKFSPKEPEHKVWEMLKRITIHSNISSCD